MNDPFQRDYLEALKQIEEDKIFFHLTEEEQEKRRDLFSRVDLAIEECELLIGSLLGK